MQVDYAQRPYSAKSAQLRIRLTDEADYKTLLSETKDPTARFLLASAKTPGGLAVAPGAEPPTDLLLGLGKASAKTCFTAARKLVRALTEREVSEGDVAIDLGNLPSELLSAFTRGLHVGAYKLDRWTKAADANEADARDGGSAGPIRFELIGDFESATGERAVERGGAEALGQLAAMDLVDRPANRKKPAMVAERCERLGAVHGFDVEVVDEAALRDRGFGGILAVGRASDSPPCLVKLHYRGGDTRRNYHLGLVGKGITFDTGGISIKPSTNLAAMKSDLGGAAAVLGTFVAAAELGLACELHGLLAVAENAVGGDAYLPSDVIRNYGGKTIEITNTDAEGRLVLADALAYLPEFAENLDLTIDLATLTGSAVQTFGYACGALFSNDARASEALLAAGDRSGERLWPLPLWEEYEEDLASDVADIKHFHAKPVAGAINAAKFLEAFAADRAHWAHLDIAGVAFGNSEFSKDRSATGYGVALLTEFLSQQIAATRA